LHKIATPSAKLKDLEKTYEREKNNVNLGWLNRIALEECCPHETPKSQKIKVIVKNKMHITDGVLNAFLDSGTYYEHGARSMEALITMSRLANERRFDASSLPPISQMILHLKNPSEFIKIAKSL